MTINFNPVWTNLSIGVNTRRHFRKWSYGAVIQ